MRLIQFLCGSIPTGAISSLIVYNDVLVEECLKSLHEKPPYKVSGPKVSIIIPAYREEMYISNLLKSIENQTYDNIEVVVACYSSPKTEDIVREFGFKVLSIDRQGIAYACNKAVDASTGKIIIRTDADCIFKHNTVEVLVNELENSDVVCTHCLNVLYDCLTIDKIVFLLSHLSKGIFTPWLTSGRAICTYKFVHYSIGGYNEELITQEDWDYGTRIWRKFNGKVRFTTKTCVATSGRRFKVLGWSLPKYTRKREEFPAVRNSHVIELQGLCFNK